MSGTSVKDELDDFVLGTIMFFGGSLGDATIMIKTKWSSQIPEQSKLLDDN